jgi:urate oxidase
MSEELGFLSAARYGTRHLLLLADRQVKTSYGSSELSVKVISTLSLSTLSKVSHTISHQLMIVMLEGLIETSYTKADNASVVATDTSTYSPRVSTDK